MTKELLFSSIYKKLRDAGYKDEEILEFIRHNLKTPPSKLPDVIRERERTENRQDQLHGRICFVASAAYGTPLSEEIKTLSRFRDTVLVEKAWGRNLVQMYYRLSPPLANYIYRRSTLRMLVRIILTPLVRVIRALSGELND